MKTYRVYTNVKKIGEDYYEAEYKEYIGNELHCIGTEDFSKQRLHSATMSFDVYKHSGRINRAGGKMTECVGTIRTSRNACKIAVARMMYGDVARVSR